MKEECCICGKKNEIVFSYKLDLNRFDWWHYVLEDKYTSIENAFKLRHNKWYGYIGYVPILNEVVYFLWDVFHKKAMIELNYCKRCV